MNNKKTLSSNWAILPLLLCSATVLAGDGGYDAPYGQVPPPPSAPLTLEGSAAPDANLPADVMSQAQNLGQESDGFVDDSTEASGVNTGYVGGNTRIGIGVDTELKGKVEASQIFGNTESSATIGQGYLGFNPSADAAAGEEMLTGAGAKISHHWVSGDANNPAHVNKVFGAYDQNEHKDKKATVGYGQENANLFWSGHVSKGLSEGRTTATPGVTEKAYDLGVGGRVGTFLPQQSMRLQGGLDYEWAEDVAASEKRAAQTTITGGVEKFFPDTPHSVGAELEVYKKAGGALTSEDAEARGGVSYRYDIGSEAGVWQPEQRYRRIRTEIPGEQVKQPPKIERKLVKNTMELESDTFFKLDSAKLTPEAQERMKAVIGQIRGSGYDGNIRITGNTCDKGSDAHNKKLSENRANAVRDFMIKNGFSANELLAQGLGESQPKYPNTDAEGHKNRRVDIEYVTYQNEYKDEVIEAGGTSTTDPKVVWRKELIPEPPLWVRQALRNTADHKQTVDTYKTVGGEGDKEGNNPTVPVAANDSATTASGTPVTIAVLANDTDPNGDPLNIVSFNQGTNGSVAQDGNKLVYTPIAGFTGTDTFTYIITDPAGNQSTATVTVTVGATVPSSVAPVAGNDTGITNRDTPVTLDVLANDKDPNGDPLSIVSFNQGTNGSVTQDGNKLVYTPASGFTGTDSFTYIIADPAGNQSTATVTVTVNPSKLPVMLDDVASTVSGESVDINVLSNDSSPVGMPLTVGSYTDPANGTVTQAGNMLTYTPKPSFVGTDTFTYVATDPEGNSAIATVTVTVTSPLLDKPVAKPDATETTMGKPVTVDVLANDKDAVSIASFTQGSNGTAAKDGNGLSYTPNPDFFGIDTFTYIAQDANGNASNETTVTITVTKDNSPPVAKPDAKDTTSGTAVSVDVLANDEDVDGDPLSIVSVTQGANGRVTQDGNLLTYLPDANFTGTDHFDYVITDGKDHQVTATVTITVTAPVTTLTAVDDNATKGPLSLNDLVPRRVDVLANDTGDTLTIVEVGKPDYGTAEIITWQGKQMIRYTLRSGYCIDHRFTYKIRDKHGKEASAHVFVDVEPAGYTGPTSTPTP
ncbi:tandem-95 repeat protein [Thiothrix subterranea]|uniref:Ig-like domain-containing protein n=1 Tax=Thiothrix subterranea TaxID=2735563 RepID=UPI00192AF81C|nr:Ig-like domain-containing protein [Thiothrix subterranea]QQZ29830.1 tandem-95 repeat protein [Thiothrix subterranea]